jgi:hypothetical protein
MRDQMKPAKEMRGNVEGTEMHNVDGIEGARAEENRAGAIGEWWNG